MDKVLRLCIISNLDNMCKILFVTLPEFSESCKFDCVSNNNYLVILTFSLLNFINYFQQSALSSSSSETDIIGTSSETPQESEENREQVWKWHQLPLVFK